MTLEPRVVYDLSYSLPLGANISLTGYVKWSTSCSVLKLRRYRCNISLHSYKSDLYLIYWIIWTIVCTILGKVTWENIEKLHEKKPLKRYTNKCGKVTRKKTLKRYTKKRGKVTRKNMEKLHEKTFYFLIWEKAEMKNLYFR